MPRASDETRLGILLTGEPVGIRRWSAIAVGFAGVLIIVQPGSESFSWLTSSAGSRSPARV